MPRIAFMPWVAIETETSLLGCDFVPYRRDRTDAPPGVKQVLDCYQHGGGGPVRRATLIKVDGAIVSDLDEATRARVFKIESLLAFAGLARRGFSTVTA